MTKNYDRHNSKKIQLSLEKMYLPKIKKSIQEKNSQKDPKDKKTEENIKKEAKNIIDLFFIFGTNHSKLFLEWYINKSFENEPIENIPLRIEYFSRHKNNSIKEDHKNYKTYQDYLKTQEIEIHIDANKNLKNSLKSLTKDKEIFHEEIFRDFFKFCRSILSFKKDRIILSFLNYTHKRTFSISYEEIPEDYKKTLDQKIITLKEMTSIHHPNYLNHEKNLENTKNYAQKIFDNYLWPLFQKKGLFQDFSDLNKSLQKYIVHQIESYLTLQKKTQIVTDLFQNPFILTLKENSENSNQDYLDIELGNRNNISDEDYEKIKKFLQTPKDVFRESYITPEEYIWGIKRRYISHIPFYPNPITAHEKIKLKKLFSEL